MIAKLFILSFQLLSYWLKYPRVGTLPVITILFPLCLFSLVLLHKQINTLTKPHTYNFKIKMYPIWMETMKIKFPALTFMDTSHK